MKITMVALGLWLAVSAEHIAIASQSPKATIVIFM